MKYAVCQIVFVSNNMYLVNVRMEVIEGVENRHQAVDKMRDLYPEDAVLNYRYIVKES